MFFHPKARDKHWLIALECLKQPEEIILDSADNHISKIVELLLCVTLPVDLKATLEF
ncbi:hypothetical protein SK128_026438 [Halocaridina rubra]|uniref:Uncharacterized protein n=1 Tax=Halocaridina rubra TaxID=373956 RepID=A0AAN8WDA6_HALRR